VLIKNISAKSIITPSSLPETDYVINPSVGCEHGCIYCYARFMKRWSGESREWGEFLKIKENAPELVRREIEKIPPGKTILLASVTDPYSIHNCPLTRKILEAIVASSRSDLRISILTKSTRVLKDANLLLRLKAEVGISLSTINSRVASLFEPKVPSPKERLAALSELRRSGLNTYCFLGPILPGITLLEEAIEEIVKSNPCFIMVEGINLKGGVYSRVRKVYEENFPHLLASLKEAHENPRKFWSDIKERIRRLRKKKQLPIKVYFH